MKWINVQYLSILLFLTPSSFDKKSLQIDSRLIQDNPSITNISFEGGEEISYKIYYNWGMIWLSAGEVVFKIEDLGNDFKISAKGKTYKSYEWFFKVDDYYESIINKETMLPKRFIRNVHEGNFTMYNEVKFDQEKYSAESLKGKSKDLAKTKNFKTESCIHDMISAIYFARNMNFTTMNKGEKFPIKMFIDDETWNLQVMYKGIKNKLEVKGHGNFNTHYFSPEVVKGHIFKESDQLKLYVSNDENKIPIMIESPVSVGSIKVVLKSYKGLKYPLHAKN